jgi:hypothetical protein
MSTITSPRKAERFARLIDLRDPTAVADAEELRGAVTVAAALRAAGRAGTPQPLSEDARLAMRQRLVAAANVQGAAAAEPARGRPAAATRRISRRATALVGSVVVITSVSGVGVATARSLPGSPFYDLKRATESVQLWFASGAAEEGQRHLDFARARLAEARKLGPDSPYVASTLRDMNQETREGSSDLIDAYRSSGQNQPLAALVTFTRKQYADLASFGDAAGVALQSQTVYSLTLLAGVVQQVQSVSGTTCLTCLVTGKPQHPAPATGGHETTSPKPAPSASGSTPASSPSSHSSPSQPGPKPSGLLPPGLLPTQLPTKLPTLPPLLGGKNGKKTGGILPTLSPLPLISTLTHLLSGR